MADLVWYRSIYWRIALGFRRAARHAARPADPGVPLDLRPDGRSVSESVRRRSSPARLRRTCRPSSRAADARRRCVREFALLGCVAGISPSCCRTVARSSASVFRRRRMLARIARSRLFDDPYSDRRSGGRVPWPRAGRRRPAGVRSGRSGGPGGPRGLAVEFAFINVNGTVAGIVAVPVEPPPLSMTLAGPGTDAGHRRPGLADGRHDGRGSRDLPAGTPALERAAGRGARDWRGRDVGVRAPVTGGDEVVTPRAQLQRDGQRARAADAGARTLRPHHDASCSPTSHTSCRLRLRRSAATSRH